MRLTINNGEAASYATWREQLAAQLISRGENTNGC